MKIISTNQRYVRSASMAIKAILKTLHLITALGWPLKTRHKYAMSRSARIRQRYSSITGKNVRPIVAKTQISTKQLRIYIIAQEKPHYKKLLIPSLAHSSTP